MSNPHDDESWLTSKEMVAYLERRHAMRLNARRCAWWYVAARELGEGLVIDRQMRPVDFLEFVRLNPKLSRRGLAKIIVRRKSFDT